MINVENVSMRFNLGRENIYTFKEFIVKKLKGQIKVEEFWALKDISLNLEKGQVLGILGVNGAGKSTLLKVISGVLKPTTGKVKVEGIIAPMIELGAGFDSELTASENIFLNGAILGYSKEFIKSKYDDIVEFSELQDFMNVPIRNFSSGMIARLAFSISTLVQPEILIIDEILGVGDAPFQIKSNNRIKELMNGGTTVILVSHSIQTIKDLCTKAVWLDHGAIKDFGEAKDVCKKYEDFCMGV